MTDFSFFWHDYETFGRVPRRDRPAQFAGVRTDAALNEIGDPVELFCQPVPDSLPDPESCLLTGITPQHCLAQGVPEHQFADQILAALGAPGTVGVGYNSIRFDDEVTRHLFWRNLIDPYGREWQNGCGRWDLLDVLRCAYALRPEGIEWPRHPDGRPSFKLEHLTAANGLAHDAAHDALSDVRATIALARLVRDRQPKLFEFCLKLRKKDAVWQEIGPLGDARRPLLHISGMYPAERGCIGLVWPLAGHPTNKNELIVWDLAHDPAELVTLDDAALRLRMFSRNDELPEGVTRLPVKTIHINKSPVVIANLKTLAPAMAERWGLDLAAGLAHADWARHNHAALEAVPWRAVFDRPASGVAADVDQDLYGGFIAPNDRRTLDRLRGLSGEQLAGNHPAFGDGRLDELLFRYRARNFSSTLDAAELQRWQHHCSERLHGGVGGGQTLAQFSERIDDLFEAADERGQAILGALCDYAEQIAPEVN
jgi:exodeoxyribonuclease-1